MSKFKITVTTKSNLFIGGNPTMFEIGGVDQYTIVDTDQRPYIPASTLKGVFRQCLKEVEKTEKQERILNQYKQILTNIKDANENRINSGVNIEKDRKDKLPDTLSRAIQLADITYLFGISGFNRTPKLIFNDLKCITEDSNALFSIDTKNTILIDEQDIHANPRTYKTVRPGVIFQGEILLYKLEESGFNLEDIEDCLNCVRDACNCGLCRIGGSGSRGYGRVFVEIERG